MSETLVIRADASPEIGTGHVMRCLALAQAWADQLGPVVFAMAESTSGVRDRIRAEGFDLVEVPANVGSPRDREFLSRLAEKREAAWLVLDSYRFDVDYQDLVTQGASKVLCIDDEGRLPEYSADLILNQNLHASPSLYAHNARTGLLVGIEYVLLRKEFVEWSGRTSDHPQVARSVLVSLGGGAQLAVAETVLRALHCMRTPDASVTFITGSASAGELSRAWNSSGISFVTNPPNLPELMANADVAVSAAGATCWELAYFGVPSLVIDVAPNQTPIAKALQSGGFAIHLGSGSEVSAESLANQLRKLMLSKKRRLELSHACRTLVDGRGAQRVMAAMADRERDAPGSRKLAVRG